MEKWKTLERKTVFEARPYLEVIRERVAVSPELVIEDFYQVLLRPFVVCVPFLPDGTVLTMRQYKHGPRKVSLTFPGGFVDAGELPSVACARELLEETGYCAEHWIWLGEFTDNGNQKGCVGNFFVALGCKQLQDPHSGDLEEMEILRSEPVQMDKALFDGSIVITHHAFAWLMAKEWLATEHLDAAARNEN